MFPACNIEKLGIHGPGDESTVAIAFSLVPRPIPSFSMERGSFRMKNGNGPGNEATLLYKTSSFSNHSNYSFYESGKPSQSCGSRKGNFVVKSGIGCVPPHNVVANVPNHHTNGASLNPIPQPLCEITYIFSR